MEEKVDKNNAAGGSAHGSEERREEGEENRKEMDDIPPHGTDPLHEGP